ncbi:hypothetical protein HanRHA438_Chr12g0568621 [Helianthus annuus]|nr:hypothetical protein HanRHA438_Chr12g0568621 [Helianthus annuus]
MSLNKGYHTKFQIRSSYIPFVVILTSMNKIFATSPNGHHTMKISFIVANIDLFYFLVNLHGAHALFVVHVVHLSYKDHRKASFHVVLLKVQISFCYT